MSEHLRNLRLGWIGFGWFVAVALTALAVVALAALDLLRQGTASEGIWVAASIAAGFLVAGFFIGTRVAAAPLLTGLAMGVFSIVAWLAVNLLLGEPTNATAWNALRPRTAVSLLVLQTAAAVLGTRAGVRWTRRTD
jgi:hypothetical protein